jgi:hypothetical protein
MSGIFGRYLNTWLYHKPSHPLPTPFAPCQVGAHSSLKDAGHAAQDAVLETLCYFLLPNMMQNRAQFR